MEQREKEPAQASYGNARSYTYQELLDNYVDPYAVDPRGV